MGNLKKAESSPEQGKETVRFNNHANYGKTQKHHKNATKEGSGAFDFVPLKEKAKCAIHSNDTAQTTKKQNLQQ